MQGKAVKYGAIIVLQQRACRLIGSYKNPPDMLRERIERNFAEGGEPLGLNGQGM
jgi:hypothetical protein